jgi:hypothetical protein
LETIQIDLINIKQIFAKKRDFSIIKQKFSYPKILINGKCKSNIF